MKNEYKTNGGNPEVEIERKPRKTLMGKLGNFLEGKGRAMAENAELGGILKENGYKRNGDYFVQEGLEEYVLVPARTRNKTKREERYGLVLVDKEKGDVKGILDRQGKGKMVPIGLTEYNKFARVCYVDLTPPDMQRGILIEQAINYNDNTGGLE